VQQVGEDEVCVGELSGGALDSVVEGQLARMSDACSQSYEILRDKTSLQRKVTQLERSLHEQVSSIFPGKVSCFMLSYREL
jgi:hypothetical protein